MRPYKISDKGPIFVDSDRVATFDVDDTLVTPNAELFSESTPVEFGEPGRTELLYPITPHIKLLKEFAARDFFIIVWSDGGQDWARKVVEKLGLTNYVDLVMSKPMWYVDDKEATDWCQKRTYKVVTPEFRKLADKIIMQNSRLLDDLAKGPPCEDHNCGQCNSEEEE